MKKNTAIFANYICHFGGDKVLLDLAKEVVVPSFTSDTYVRSYGDTSYHFFEVELVTLDDTVVPPVLGLSGRFIKNTLVTRVQVFDDAHGIVKDPRAMASAPSVFFLLILNSHRLIYMPETPAAPNLDAFRATSQIFLTKKHKEFVNLVYNIPANREKKITKKRIMEVYPPPILNVVTLTGSDDIGQFIDRYSVLQKIDFRLIKPNDDIDGGEIFDQMRAYSANLGADRTKFTVANTADGLDKDAAIESVKEATSRGNQEITLDGTDEYGRKLHGNNENFQVQVEIKDVPSDPAELTRTLYEKYRDMVGNGNIYEPVATEEVIKKIQKLVVGN